ncbi:MAG: hypothetical protein M0P10_09185 [Sphaerochaetaceae bacterium]|nr:hypothetical protein [Sphaerochaetaceae bacterium]
MHAKNRIVATLKGDGSIRLIEEAIPEIKDGWVLIKTSKSLVSPGTELKGWDALARQKKEPNYFQNQRNLDTHSLVWLRKWGRV